MHRLFGKMSRSGKSSPPPPSSHQDYSDPPPAYTARAEEASSSFAAQLAGVHQPTTTTQAYLASLTHGVSQAAAASRDSQVSGRDREDAEILSSLTAQAADFLADVGAWLSSPRRGGSREVGGSRSEAEIYFVPRGVLSEDGWHAAGAEERERQGVLVREARVGLSRDAKTTITGGSGLDEKPKNEGYGASYWVSGGEVGELRDQLWWDDESQAHRLARGLETEIKGPQDLSRRQVMQNVKDARSSTRHDDESASSAESVKTKVWAEQTTFRRENEMGLWESQSGWTIILAVTITP